MSTKDPRYEHILLNELINVCYGYRRFHHTVLEFKSRNHNISSAASINDRLMEAICALRLPVKHSDANREKVGDPIKLAMNKIRAKFLIQMPLNT